MTMLGVARHECLELERRDGFILRCVVGVHLSVAMNVKIARIAC